ncbi:hypothetical protein CGCA056_v013524 [Colletotrichum aenigma]|uniref:uncharacterized protein n=1 Tax=Colletotrichum aenigma TaxID=1215731 RepID=UPI001872FAAB|nr:uncharacterized protein CGCA056_v013524 [Colletotrichum aenigma]KAF5507351.1 hypothetical protein CGCA056_v013524 [Colletotrichum aenigma]
MATREGHFLADDDRRASSRSSVHSETSGVTLNNADSGRDVAVTDDIGHLQPKNFPSARAYMSVPTEEPQRHSSNHRQAAAEKDDNESKKIGNSNQPLGNLNVLRLWKYEFLAIIVSVLAFIAMMILLKVSDGKPQPQFAYSINLTTTIAIFTTLLRAAMVFVVAEVIGQCKWLWMDQPRPLRHIEHFDNAGRGIWGSVRLLFLTLKPKLTVLASLIVITSYAVGPFVQQAVKTYPCPIDGKGIAKISIAERVIRSDAYVGAQVGGTGDRAVIKNLRVAPELQITALNGLLADTPTGSVNLFQCDSGNCTFPLRGQGVTHTSLGLCSTCTDVRSKLLESRHISNFSHVFETDRDYRFDNRSDFGISTFFKSGIFNMTTERTNPYRTTEDYENTETSILSFTAKGCARTKDPNHGSLTRYCEHNYENTPGLFPEFDIVAANCSLHPCLRRYNANVVNGVLNEKLVSTAPAGATNISYVQANIADEVRNTHVFRNFSYVAMSEPCIIKDIWYDSSNISQAPRDGVKWTSWGPGDTLHEAPSECLVLMDPTELLGIRRFFLQTLKGSCAKTTSGSNRPTSSLEDGRINCEGGFWVDAFFNNGNATFDDISTAFDNMATALTNRMRAKGREFLTEARSFTSGTAVEMSICMRVDWPWLVYPGVLLVLTSIILAATYAQSCRDRGWRPIWKSSILPLLFYRAETQHTYLDKQRDSLDATQALPLMQLAELETIADATKARFCSGRDIAGFIVDKTSPEAA